MKKIIPVTFLFFLYMVTYAQQNSFIKTPALGVHVSFFDFKGADSMRAFGRNGKTGVAIHYQNNLSKRFDYSVMLAGSFLEFADRKNNNLGNGKKQLLLETDVSVRAKLFTRRATLFNPYAQLGAGVSTYNTYFGLFIPAGVGCHVNITREVFLLVNSQYRLPVTNTQHRHFFNSIGIAGTINRKKMERVTQVLLPTAPETVLPKDTDGDGIVDSADVCPQIAGVIRYHGCPPPDRDGDGIIDEDDKCPDVKGVRAYKGCPMPDRDQDGILDSLDKCPDQGGNASNGGCPEIRKELIAKINFAAKNIFFKTGRYRLLEKSNEPLNEVVQILNDNPALRIIIEGHTDNTGTPNGNQVLSENRAEAVKKYLIQKSGINASRLQSFGYGQQQPVVDNNSPEGRSKNRRVEMKLVYHF